MICSPTAAKSRYVNEEVRLFKARPPDRMVVPLIVDGKPGDAERECFPPALKFEVDEDGSVTERPLELLAADGRDDADGKDLALAKIVAGLLGLRSDDVFRRAERERRAAARRRRRVQAAIGVLAVLLVAAAIGWINQDYLKEQYHWQAVMGGKPLTEAQERALEPSAEFADCEVGCPVMVVIPAGTYAMGSDEGQDRERPAHDVTIAKPFAVSKYELTFDAWDSCAATGNCPAALDAGWGRFRQPVINVNREDAKHYVAWLSRITGKTYRLLSEAEWEYAARGGSTTRFASGDDESKLGDYAWHSQNAAAKAHPVGEKMPNAFGLHDMYGNVWEWVEDPWHENYVGAPSDGSAWIEGGNPLYWTMRGGAWNYVRGYLTSSFRSNVAANGPTRLNFYGFRVARDLDR